MSSATPAEQFLRILREQGGRAGNGKLRDLLGMGEDAYAALRDQLAAQGAIVKGRGQGGSVALTDRTPAPPAPQPDLLAPLAPEAEAPPPQPAKPTAPPNPAPQGKSASLSGHCQKFLVFQAVGSASLQGHAAPCGGASGSSFLPIMTGHTRYSRRLPLGRIARSVEDSRRTPEGGWGAVAPVRLVRLP